LVFPFHHKEILTMRVLSKWSFLGMASAALLVAGGFLAPARAADEKAKLEVGKPAPGFDLACTQIEKALPGSKAKSLKLAELQGKNVVLFFFPKAMTRG
jgi:hypothetical protein